MHHFHSHQQKSAASKGIVFQIAICIAFSSLVAVSLIPSVSNQKLPDSMEEFVGTYVFEKDNGKFEDFLKALGLNYVIRKLASKSTPTIEVSLKDDNETMVVKSITTFRTWQAEFKFNVVFEEKRLDGTTTKSLVKREGNKIIHTQDAAVPTEVIREFFPDRLIVTSKCKGVVSIREYKKTA